MCTKTTKKAAALPGGAILPRAGAFRASRSLPRERRAPRTRQRLLPGATPRDRLRDGPGQ